jgi:hypothetical protein
VDARPGDLVVSEHLGTAAEEAAKLLSAAEQWARSHAAGVLDGEHLATGSPECQVCPLCQVVGGLRHVKPETVEHVLDAAASLVAALRTAFAKPGGGSPAPSPGVQHIHVSDD